MPPTEPLSTKEMDGLKRVLVMCEQGKGHNPGMISLNVETFRRLLDAARASSLPAGEVGEPVAWRVDSPCFGWQLFAELGLAKRQRAEWHRDPGVTIQPLYATPTQPTQPEGDSGSAPLPEPIGLSAGSDQNDRGEGVPSTHVQQIAALCDRMRDQAGLLRALDRAAPPPGETREATAKLLEAGASTIGQFMVGRQIEALTPSPPLATAPSEPNPPGGDEGLDLLNELVLREKMARAGNADAKLSADDLARIIDALSSRPARGVEK